MMMVPTDHKYWINNKIGGSADDDEEEEEEEELLLTTNTTMICTAESSGLCTAFECN